MRIRQSRRAGGLALAALVLLLAACGGADGDDPGAAGEDGARTLEVEMVDTAFEPDRVSVSEGEEVRFVFTNSGKVRHEGYVGTVEDQADHEKEMAEGGGGAGHDVHGGRDDDGRSVTPSRARRTSSPTDSPTRAPSRSAATSPATTRPA